MDIQRHPTYHYNTEKIGKSADNIKTISNFISHSECNKIIESLKSQAPKNTGGQWDGMEYDPDPAILPLVLDARNRALDAMLKAYGVPLTLIPNPHIVKWSKGKYMDEHCDDIGIAKYNISGIIYLNQEYSGGEINFKTSDTCYSMTIKPNAGDLIIFPGNSNYPHSVNEILSGDRYTMPVWAKYKI